MLTIALVLEILGSPKDHVEKTLRMVIDKLKAEEGIKLIKETVYEAQEIKQLWSTFADLELEIRDAEKLIDICFDYMPSSIEILDPQSMDLGSKTFGDMLNDLLARLHKYDMMVKSLRAENILLKKGR